MSSKETRLLLTVKHVSQITTLSESTIWRLQRNNKMPKPLTIGKNVRWRKVDIVKWIDLECPSKEGCEKLE